MDDDGVPRIARLSGAELARVVTVAMHSPRPSPQETLTWTVTLLTREAVPLAQSLATSPDYPVPLSEIAQPHLDVAGLTQIGRWRAEQTADGMPRFSAPVRPLPEGG